MTVVKVASIYHNMIESNSELILQCVGDKIRKS